jgi:putative ABC transport system ATP-binding protein
MKLPADPRPLVVLRNLEKRYEAAAGLAALRQVNMEIHPGEFLAIMGKSGSGKSTLLNLIAGIDNASSGGVWVDGHALHAMNESHRATWRGRSIGIVFQFFQLLPTLTILENVMLPMDFCTVIPRQQRAERAHALLQKLGIPEQAGKLPAELSGGQQQRAAIARALANNPAILVADEPTGNLDSETASGIMALFAELVRQGTTVVMVTHERDYVPYFSRVITLVDGAIRTDVLEPMVQNA